jgi:hypothetical protein
MRIINIDVGRPGAEQKFMPDSFQADKGDVGTSFPNPVAHHSLVTGRGVPILPREPFRCPR